MVKMLIIIYIFHHKNNPSYVKQDSNGKKSLANATEDTTMRETLISQLLCKECTDGNSIVPPTSIVQRKVDSLNIVVLILEEVNLVVLSQRFPKNALRRFHVICL